MYKTTCTLTSVATMACSFITALESDREGKKGRWRKSGSRFVVFGRLCVDNRLLHLGGSEGCLVEFKFRMTRFWLLALRSVRILSIETILVRSPMDSISLRYARCVLEMEVFELDRRNLMEVCCWICERPRCTSAVLHSKTWIRCMHWTESRIIIALVYVTAKCEAAHMPNRVQAVCEDLWLLIWVGHLHRQSSALVIRTHGQLIVVANVFNRSAVLGMRCAANAGTRISAVAVVVLDTITEALGYWQWSNIIRGLLMVESAHRIREQELIHRHLRHGEWIRNLRTKINRHP